MKTKLQENCIIITCPVCAANDEISFPKEIFSRENQIITVSIPQGTICEHPFQLYLDNDYNIKGYQKIDYTFPKIEYYNDNIPEINSNDKDEGCSEKNKINTFFRNIQDQVQILGISLFSSNGGFIYSSMPKNTLLIAMNEYNIRTCPNILKAKKMIIELDEGYITSQQIQIKGVGFVIFLLLAKNFNISYANLLSNQIFSKIRLLL